MVRNGECSPSSEMTPVTGWKKEDELLNGLSDKSVKPLSKIFSVKLTNFLYPI